MIIILITAQKNIEKGDHDKDKCGRYEDPPNCIVIPPKQNRNKQKHHAKIDNPDKHNLFKLEPAKAL